MTRLTCRPCRDSSQSAPEGIRTPNLLIRSNSIDPTPTEAARPRTKPGQMFAQVTRVRTRQGGPGRGVAELRSRGILGLKSLGHRGPLPVNPAAIGKRPPVGGCQRRQGAVRQAALCRT